MPQLDTQKNLFGEIWVDTLREIAVNKVGTLIGRCEIKDLVDLYFLKAEGFDAIDLLPDAQRKEGGLEPAMLAYLLSELSVECPDYLLKPLELSAFREFIEDLETRLKALAYPDRGSK